MTSGQWQGASRYLLAGTLALVLAGLAACGGNDGPNPQPPAAPAGVSATAVSTSEINLSWTDQSGDETGFQIERKSGAGGTYAQIGTAAPNTTTFSDSGLAEAAAYFYRVRAVNGAGSSAYSNEASATTMTSLAGTWDFIRFITGGQPGWAEGTITVDGGGGIAFTSFLDDQGNTDPGPQTLALTLDVASGAVRQIDNGVLNDFRGTLSADGRLIAGVDTLDNATRSVSIVVARKRDPAVAYSDADIQGRTFALHQLNHGQDNNWEYGYGSIGGIGNLSIDNVTTPAGPVPGYPQDNVDILNVDSVGIVRNLDNTFFGLLTADKSTVFGLLAELANPNAKNRIVALQFTGGTFAQADLAGTYRFHSLAGNVSPIWFYGAIAIDASGLAVYQSIIDSDGVTTLPPNFNLTLAADGTILFLENPSYHGTMSLGKDMYVRTQTHAVLGRYGINIVLKRP